jgi:hypothetical protein
MASHINLQDQNNHLPTREIVIDTETTTVRSHNEVRCLLSSLLSVGCWRSGAPDYSLSHPLEPLSLSKPCVTNSSFIVTWVARSPWVFT